MDGKERDLSRGTREHTPARAPVASRLGVGGGCGRQGRVGDALWVGGWAHGSKLPAAVVQVGNGGGDDRRAHNNINTRAVPQVRTPPRAAPPPAPAALVETRGLWIRRVVWCGVGGRLMLQLWRPTSCSCLAVLERRRHAPHAQAQNQTKKSAGPAAQPQAPGAVVVGRGGGCASLVVVVGGLRLHKKLEEEILELQGHEGTRRGELESSSDALLPLHDPLSCMSRKVGRASVHGSTRACHAVHASCVHASFRSTDWTRDLPTMHPITHPPTHPPHPLRRPHAYQARIQPP